MPVYDVEFYMKSYDLFRSAQAGELHNLAAAQATLERYRNNGPVV